MKLFFLSFLGRTISRPVSCAKFVVDFDLSVSFPHYFLQATGHLAEQLKTREWIVARITSITERVVDPKVWGSKK